MLSRAPVWGFVCMGLVWAGFAAQVPVLKAQIGASDAVFGGIFLIASLGAVASMWIAPVFERLTARRSVQLATGLMGLAFVGAGASAGVVAFCLAFLLVSALSGVSDILLNARISEIEEASRRPLMNLNHAIFSFSYAGASVLTGLAREAGFGPVAVFSAIAAVVLALCTMMRTRPVRLADGGPLAGGGGPVGAFGSVIVWLAGLVVMAAFFTEQAAEGWSALHIERSLGGGAAQGAFGPAILGLTMGFGRLFGHALTAHIRDTTMMGWACMISAAGVAVAAVAPSVTMAYLGFGLMGLGISVVVPLAMAIVGRAVPEDQRVKAIGQASVIGYGAFMVGPALMGGIAERVSLAASFLTVAAVLVLVAALLVPWIGRHLSASAG
ncbi:MAG: MFS transporter [Rhodobacteraceae bacterium]|nr:MFS transporter [Paracoccaceae bacterium]